MDSDIERQTQEYLDGTLKGEALRQFELKMADDPRIASAVRELQGVEHALRSAGLEAFQKTVNQWEADIKAQEIKVKRFAYLAIAATISIFLIVGYFLFFQRAIQPAALYAEYYSPYEDMITVRGEDNADEAQLLTAMSAYNRKDYKEAAPLLESYLETHSGDRRANFYLAIALAESGETGRAEANFSLAMQDEQFRQQATWYLALLYVKTREIESAIQTLDVIIGSSRHYKKQEATELRSQLKALQRD